MSLKFFGFGFRFTVIPDDDNRSRTSQVNGERFVLGRGDTTTVDGAPVLTFADDRVSFFNFGSASTTGPTPTVSIEGDRGFVFNSRRAEINADDTAISISGEDARIKNLGTIDGGVNGVNFVNGGFSSGSLTNFGTIQSDSRAVNIGGDGIVVRNFGDIVGSGNQRNGTVYSDGTADNFKIFNERGAVIDAGEGNDGAGIALQTGSEPGDVVNGLVVNRGEIAGRGQAAPDVGTAGDGIRIFAGAEDVTFEGDIVNSGTVTSESNQGPVSAIRVANGVNFDGTIRNTSHGVIDGANNGLYFGTGDHDATVLNYGLIQSDSRAVNIDGTGVDLFNFGDILGTGNQRNGTVYADATADDYSVFNARSGLIDAGEGNDGAGIALQTGDVPGDVVNASVVNNGVVNGRGQAAPAGGTAGDGIRLFAGAEGATFEGDIVNRGDVTSESAQGPVSAIRIANGLNFDGEIVNTRSGVIDGANNGLYFGTGDHDATVRNFGLIQSDSRAVNIDGTGVDLFNFGDILGTGDQRNGTVYSDATAEDFSIFNGEYGVIDAGDGNNGTGISLQVGDVDGDVVEARVVNEGLVRGRGEELGNLAGDGIRLAAGVEGSITFQGDVENHGVIEGSDDGVNVGPDLRFVGDIVNTGLIDTVDDGVFLDDRVVFEGDIVNEGTIRSGDEAIHIDLDSTVTGDIRNYGDLRATENGIVLNGGVTFTGDIVNEGSLVAGINGIDFQEVEAGPVISLGGSVTFNGDIVNEGTIEAGDDGVDIDDGDVVNGDIVNEGDIFAVDDGIDLDPGATLNGDIRNYGTIEADSDGIEIGDIAAFDGSIVNEGTITGNADGLGEGLGIDAVTANVDLTVVNDGTINGDVRLGSGDDLFDGENGKVNGVIDGGGGNDDLRGGDNDDVLVGGLGNDDLDGGHGEDTARYDDVDVGVTVDLSAGTATRETGFNVSIQNLALVNPNTGIDANAIVDEAVSGNLYFNVHTSDFPAGEIRGNLTTLVSDTTVGGVRTVVVSAVLDGESEVQPEPVVTDASGTGTVTFVVAADGSVTYSLDLDVTGLNTDDLLPVDIGNGTLSPIHLHNAPPGVNGPVVTDVASDAGFDVANGEDAFDLAPGFAPVSETDTLDSIENVVGSNDGDVISGDGEDNRLDGLAGNDALEGGGGEDVLAGGQGNDRLTGGSDEDTFVFAPVDTPSADTVTDYEDGGDRFDVTAFGFADFSEIGVEQVGNDTVLTFADQNTATLVGVDAGQIDEDDFIL